ncbi:MAG: hypothetical protein K6A63_08790, partial [Acholeplasmatales bacterium]|nr:hypothetical protein [Acholeplasmatales bacterium]
MAWATRLQFWPLITFAVLIVLIIIFRKKRIRTFLVSIALINLIVSVISIIGMIELATKENSYYDSDNDTFEVRGEKYIYSD